MQRLKLTCLHCNKTIFCPSYNSVICNILCRMSTKLTGWVFLLQFQGDSGTIQLLKFISSRVLVQPIVHLHPPSPSRSSFALFWHEVLVIYSGQIELTDGWAGLLNQLPSNQINAIFLSLWYKRVNEVTHFSLDQNYLSHKLPQITLALSTIQVSPWKWKFPRKNWPLFLPLLFWQVNWPTRHRL